MMTQELAMKRHLLRWDVLSFFQFLSNPRFGCGGVGGQHQLAHKRDQPQEALRGLWGGLFAREATRLARDMWDVRPYTNSPLLGTIIGGTIIPIKDC